MSDVVIRLGEVEEVPVNVDEAEEVPVNVGEEVYIKGDKGNTFFPNVSENGDLSWSNDGGLPNPPTVNIKGPQGEPGNYTKPASGIPKSDLESAVQASLGKADTALQEHQDITGKADKVQNATSGNFAALDENGNLTDSGHKHSDYASSDAGVPSGGSTGQVLKKKSATDYDTEWASAGTADALPLAGGTMSGSINMDGNRVQNLPTPSANGDAVTKSYADSLLTDYRTASAQDVIDAAQDADIASRAKTDEIGIVIDGNSTPVGAAVGQYVIVKNSTISGVTDGLYKAALAIPANTAIDATYLSSSTVDGGGLNDLQAYRADKYIQFCSAGSSAKTITLTFESTYPSFLAFGINSSVIIEAIQITSTGIQKQFVGTSTNDLNPTKISDSACSFSLKQWGALTIVCSKRFTILVT